MTIIGTAEYLPDQPALQNPGSSSIINVVPRTALSYGPINGLSNFFNALGARCQGAIGARDSAGNAYAFAGTASKLYDATSGSSTWADVSKSGGYSVAPEEFWEFSQFGDIFCATNISDPIQAFTLNSSSAFADLSSGAPKARHMASVRDFLMVGNTNDGTYGAQPQRVWWPGIDDPTNWPTPGTSAAAAVQSDFQDILGDHGWLQGFAPHVGPVDVAIFMERAVFRGMYIGAPEIFSFLPAVGIRGCAASGSIVLTEIGAMYLSPQGFELFDGYESIPIGDQKVNKYFYSTVDQSNLFRVIATYDPINKLYFVAWPSANAINGNPDMMLVCNYSLKSAIGSLGKWSIVTGITLEYLWQSQTFGYNIDTIDSAYGNLDAIPFSLDSRILTGAKTSLSAFDTSHTAAYFTGTTLAATIATSEAQIIPGRRAMVTGAFPLVDGDSPTISPVTRNRQIDSPTVGTASATQSNGLCPITAEGRYHSFQINMAAGASWGQAQGIDVPSEFVVETGII